jgi:hypothetical protein
MTGDPEALGQVGVLVIGTRGSNGPGEVLISIRGGSESYLAWSEQPLAKGTAVLVVESRGARAVSVIRWQEPLPGTIEVPD